MCPWCQNEAKLKILFSAHSNQEIRLLTNCLGFIYQDFSRFTLWKCDLHFGSVIRSVIVRITLWSRFKSVIHPCKAWLWESHLDHASKVWSRFFFRIGINGCGNILDIKKSINMPMSSSDWDDSLPDTKSWQLAFQALAFYVHIITYTSISIVWNFWKCLWINYALSCYCCRSSWNTSYDEWGRYVKMSWVMLRESVYPLYTGLAEH